MAGGAAALALLSGCAVWVESRYPVPATYDVSGRPVSSYYCYDCHGFRYFDPYYDWCVSYGYRYAWDRNPDAVTVYRDRYVRIKEQNPKFGRYRYRAGYRDARRYREPADYESWQPGGRSARPPRAGDLKVREKDRHSPGTKKAKDKDWRDRGRRPGPKPHKERPPGGSPPGPPGGA
jgi:hypothetical protein